MPSLRVGYVPEHFSTPLFFAQQQGYYEKNGVEVEFIPFPSGSGHLIQSLKDKSIDVTIGLTEAFVAGIGKGSDFYKIVGTYVQSPLCWAISTGIKRDDIKSVKDIRGKSIGISRIGSGSHVMAFVLANKEGWTEPFNFEIHNDFKNLRDGVNHGGTVSPSDAFMWELFTTKKYYDNGEIKQIGRIYTPWPSWVISASADVDHSALKALLSAINEGITYFNTHHPEAVEYISTNLDYSAEDASAWLETVQFSKNVSMVDKTVIVDKTVTILKSAGVLDASAGDKVYLSSVNV
jgi:ABC-type nitrate/sulfonate/bicarbonate transport system substrate-binding protein